MINTEFFLVCFIEDKLNIILRVLPRLFGEKLRCWTQSNDVSGLNNFEVVTSIIHG